MDAEMKSDTSFESQVIPRPVQLFRNLCYEESMSQKSMSSLIESSSELLWQNLETDISQDESIFTSFDLHVSADTTSDESDGPMSPTFTSSPKVHKESCTEYVVIDSDEEEKNVVVCHTNKEVHEGNIKGCIVGSDSGGDVMDSEFGNDDNINVDKGLEDHGCEKLFSSDSKKGGNFPIHVTTHTSDNSSGSMSPQYPQVVMMTDPSVLQMITDNWLMRTNRSRLSGYHHEPMKLLQIMWLTTGISQRHRCRTKLVLKRRRLEVMAPTPNNFFECIADQLSHNPKMVAGGTKVIGPEIRDTVHQFVITNKSLLQPMMTPYLNDYGMTFAEYVSGFQIETNPVDLLAVYITCVSFTFPVSIVTESLEWTHNALKHSASPIEYDIYMIFNGGSAFDSSRKLIWDLFSALDEKATQAAAQSLLLNQREIIEGSSAEFVSPKKKRTYKRKPRQNKEEGKSSRKRTKASDKIVQDIQSSSAEPRSEMSISVDSSKGQVNVSSESVVDTSVHEERMNRKVESEKFDKSSIEKSVSLSSVGNGVIDASYTSEVSSKFNSSKEQQSLITSLEHKVSVCIPEEERTRINQVAKDNLEQRLKAKEKALDEKEKQLKARIEELEAENIEFKLQMLAKDDGSKENRNDEQNKDNVDKSSVQQGKPICIICQAKFSTKAELKDHISDQHKRLSPNSCGHCYMDFKSKKSLNNHIDRVHYDRKAVMNKEKCNLCEQKFGTSEELECHMKKSHQKDSQINQKPARKQSDRNRKATKKVITSALKGKGQEEQNWKAKEVAKSLERKHKCDKCCESFHTKRILLKHIRLHHPEAHLPEDIHDELPLPRRTRKPKDNSVNERNHKARSHPNNEGVADLKKYKCALCEECFHTKMGRVTHIRHAHKGCHKTKATKYKCKSARNALFTCDSCGLKVRNEEEYIKHVDSHRIRKGIKKESNITQNKPHGTYCLKCEKDFASTNALKMHFLEEHTGKRYICDKCGKSFSSKYTLSNHIKIEHDGNRIKCDRDNCDATFKRKDQYRVHLLKHDGKSLFTCVECGNGFYNKTHFRSHMDSHANRRNYPCPKCGKMFLYSHDVPKHLDICGVTEARFKCQIGTCKENTKAFKTVANLRSHHKGYHKLGEVFICSECGFQTFHEAAFKHHLNTHRKLK